MKENLECNDCGERYESHQELCRVCGGELTPLVDWQGRALKAEAEVERLRAERDALERVVEGVRDALKICGNCHYLKWCETRPQSDCPISTLVYMLHCALRPTPASEPEICLLCGADAEDDLLDNNGDGLYCETCYDDLPGESEGSE
jgi:RNA polymerase subunit RPABC4/transcription elongation factor Spt4